METLLDTFFRSILSIIVLFLITELMGKKQISQLNMFDYIIGISIGSIAASLSVDDSIHYIDGIFCIIIYGGVATLISVLTTKSIVLRRFFTGTPSVLIDKGKIIYSNLKKSHMDVNDFLQVARENGYYDISQIYYSILEPSGKVSFLPKSKYIPVTPNDMKLKVSDQGLCANLLIDGKLMKNNIKNIGKDVEWVTARLKNMGYEDISKLLLVVCDNKEQFTVYEKTDTIDVANVLE
ncbi:MAG: DUF421 domain-containing protein [bacterium]|nr:DUF421 domain-containing protein [bacterium]